MNRSGFSLLELIVAIAVVGLIVAIVAVAPQRPRSSMSLVQSTVKAALSSGRTIVARDSSDAQVVSIAAYPSGLIVTDTTYTQIRSFRADSTPQ